jgi:hypothetical protein
MPTNKLERIQFCLAQLNPCQLDDHDPTFLDMFDRIYIDEKWFYMTKTARKFYLVASEAELHRICKPGEVTRAKSRKYVRDKLGSN